MALDVTYPLPIIEIVAREAIQKYGRMDYLIYAAGYILEGAVEKAGVIRDKCQGTLDLVET